MVNYLPQTATRTITVITLEVGTTLTITAPSEVVQGGAFGISGYLTRNDTGAGIPGATVTLSYNGTLLGSDTTSIEGHYLFTGAIIPEPGTFILTASFAGSTRPGLILGSSQAPRGVGVSLLPAQVILALLAASLGLGLVVASRT